jgi:uncharacterized protein
MNTALRKKFISIAKKNIKDADPSHDIQHALRALKNAELIARAEHADLDILIPAVLFHDVVNIPKHHRNADSAADKSAKVVQRILKKIPGYPQEKIENVCIAISSCSFNKGIRPELLEAKILQDVDGLEAVGAISIMRTFATTGQIKRPFYNPEDPFCKHREPDSSTYGLDLFYKRLLMIQHRLHTKTAKRMAKDRTAFLHTFLHQLEKELG